MTGKVVRAQFGKRTTANDAIDEYCIIQWSLGCIYITRRCMNERLQFF